MDDYTLKPAGEGWGGHPRFEVWQGDTLRGIVEGCNPTFERRPEGRRYVTKRWTSKKRYWRAALPGGDTGGRYAVNFDTRKRAAESLIRRQERDDD